MNALKGYRGFLLGVFVGIVAVLAMGAMINKPMAGGGTVDMYRLEMVAPPESDYVYYAVGNTLVGEVHTWKARRSRIEIRSAEE